MEHSARYPPHVPLILVGIDEAGYGPLLGPLCVGMSAFRIDEWTHGEGAPDLWKLLRRAVTRKAADRKGRIPVEDSKKLKLANDGPRDPLTHLERSVLAFLHRLGHAPATDSALFASLRSAGEGLPWYDSDPCRCPRTCDAACIAIAANMLGGAMVSAGVSPLDLACRVIGERAFNRTVREEQTKAAATAIGLREHLTRAWEQWGADETLDDHGPRVICDRQGGRTAYAAFLAAVIPGVKLEDVSIIEQCAERCRYLVRGVGSDGRARRMTVVFKPEAESDCLAVALASMTAKLVRELLMARFNRYWSARAAAAGIAELRPTAGYNTDARRWLRDAEALVQPAEREDLVRIA